MANIERVAILTSGGDAPGMNAALRAATLLFDARDVEVLGVRSGFRGLLEDNLRPLEVNDVSDIGRQGGTILGSARCPAMHDPRGRDQARATLLKNDIDALLVIGGNGSLAGLQKLVSREEAGREMPHAIGIPASIDNDIGLTGGCIGVDTALNTIVEACDKITDTARAFDRTFIVEVMGRDSGYLALTSGIAASADTVLFPEEGASADQLARRVVETAGAAATRHDGPRDALVVMAEGVDTTPEDLKERVDDLLSQADDPRVAGIDTRVTVLGHLVRGGSPSGFDRLLAARFARVAVEALTAGKSGQMVAWMMPQDPPESVARRSPGDPYCWLVDIDAVLEETRKMLDGKSDLVRWRARAFDEIQNILMM